MNPRSRTRSKLPAAAALVILLVLRLLVTYLRLEWRRKRGTARFARELRRAGMSASRVRALAEDYRSLGSLRSLLRKARLPIPFM